MHLHLYLETIHEWIRRGLLSKLSYSTTKYLDYLYDVDGRRIEKSYTLNGTVTTHTYRLDGNKIVYEKIASGTTSYELIYLYVMDELVGFVYNGENYYYQKNFRNDIIGVYNSSGSLVARYEYDAWGNHKVYTATGVESTLETFIGNINPFRYRGYYFDRETGLYYCNARYYNPKTCRWISPDSKEYLEPQTINGLNLYTYCLNDPVNKYDPNGHSFRRTVFIIGAILLAAASTYVTYKVSEEVKDLHYSRIEKGKEYEFKDNYFDYTSDELEKNFREGVAANCHQFSAPNYGDHIKLITKDGRYEAIYDKNTGLIVTDPRDIGTYNFYDPETNPVGHAIVDVVPWVFWGNSEEDTTNIFQRLAYMMKG